MIAANYFTSNEDIIRHFDKIINWKELIDNYENNFQDAEDYKKTGNERLSLAPTNYEEALDYYKSSLDTAGDLAGNELSQQVRDIEKTGLKYDNGKVIFPEQMIKAVEKVKEAGILPYSISRHMGGLGLPFTVQSIAMELSARADAAFSIAIGCFNLAETIEKYASKEMVEKYVPLLAEGKLCGAMALTEPNYGSDLPNVQTKAVKNADGQWTVTGTKRFITHGCGFGDIPSVILTLARTGTPTSGARGLSFFLVHSKDVHIASIEKKLGLHCSPTCEVVYENSPAELIGEEGMGLVKYSMGMMNTARLSIAAQSLGIATAAYYEGKKYASERVQFGKLIQEIPAVKKMLQNMERELYAMRCLLYEAGRSVDLYLWRSEHLKHSGRSEKEVKRDEQISLWEKLANLFTPMSKYYISETANWMASNAIQIHGGSGYTEDYDVAKIYRDARITNIYEGTTQLQIVACIGGIVAGLTPKGNLRTYIDLELGKFKASERLLEVKNSLEKIYTVYSEKKDSGYRDTYAFEMVESATRFINGLLLERSASRLEGEEKNYRLKLADDYNKDSLAILAGNLVKVNP